MLKAIVKTVPKDVVQVRATEGRPTITTTVIDEKGQEKEQIVNYVIPSKLSQLLGEAKALPKGKSMLIVGIDNRRGFAYFARRNGLKLMHNDDVHYLVRYTKPPRIEDK
jgi:hypothetical protein